MGFLHDISNGISHAAHSVESGLSSVAHTVESGVSSVAHGVVGAVEGLPEDLMDIGHDVSNAASSVVHGISSIPEEISSGVGGVVHSAETHLEMAGAAAHNDISRLGHEAVDAVSSAKDWLGTEVSSPGFQQAVHVVSQELHQGEQMALHAGHAAWDDVIRPVGSHVINNIKHPLHIFSGSLADERDKIRGGFASAVKGLEWVILGGGLLALVLLPHAGPAARYAYDSAKVAGKDAIKVAPFLL